MKIGMIVNNMEVSGGYHKLVIRLTQQLYLKGHETVVYTPSVNKKECYPNDIKTIKIRSLTKKELKVPIKEQFKLLSDGIPRNLDAIIIHDPLSLYAVAYFEPVDRTKIIWMLNNQFEPADLGLSTLPEKLIAKLRRKPLYTQLGKDNLIRQGLDKVDNFVTYDSFNENLIKKYLNRKAEVVYAGADLESYKECAKGRSFKKKKSYHFLSVGVAFPHRRYEDVVGAAAVLRNKDLDIKFTIVGRKDLHPDYSSSIDQLIAKNDADDYIKFLDYVTDKKMLALYKKSDGFIFVNDGFTWGIAVFEAVAAKLPVIITNNIGAADLIKDHHSGWVVNPRSPTEIAEAIVDFVEHPSKAKNIADTAYNELTTFLSWDAYADRMLKIINEDS